MNESSPIIVTVLALAIHRGAKADADGSYSGNEIELQGLPFMGGCGRCGSSIAAYNAAPSQFGYLCCAEGCIGEDGWTDLEEANRALFGPFVWVCCNPICHDEGRPITSGPGGEMELACDRCGVLMVKKETPPTR